LTKALGGLKPHSFGHNWKKYKYQGIKSLKYINIAE
jgi:hypothetical protein